MPRVRPIRLARAEVEWLLEAGASRLWDGAPKLRDKLLASLEVAPKCVNIGPMEDVLVTYSRGKVLPMGPGGHARASRMATDLGVTPEQLKVVGVWLARQGWLSPTTIITVLNKWAEWLPRAQASAPSAGIKEGLGVRGTEEPDLGSDPDAGGPPAPKGRPAPGLGGAGALPRANRVRGD